MRARLVRARVRAQRLGTCPSTGSFDSSRGHNDTSGSAGSVTPATMSFTATRAATSLLGRGSPRSFCDPRSRRREDSNDQRQRGLRSIENANGARRSDTLIGSALTNVLPGGKGADHVEGRAGDDALDGSYGVDFLDGGDAVDTCADGETTVSCEG